MKKILTAILLVCLLLCGFTPSPSPRPYFAAITVDQNTSYQTFLHWDATAQIGGDEDEFSDVDDFREALLDMIVDDGFNGIRLEVKTRDENDVYANSPTDNNNDNGDANSINTSGFQWGTTDKRGLRGQIVQIANEMRSRLAAQNESLYSILCFVDFRFGASYFEQIDTAAEYSELMEAAFVWMDTNYGWTPDAIEVILEPDWSSNTNNYTAAKIAAALIATQSRLSALGFNPRFIVPSVTNCTVAATWYSDIKTANSSVTQYIDEVAYHRYTSCNDTQLGTLRDAAEADGNSIYMAEWIGAGADILHTDIKVGRASSWQQFTFAYDSALGDDGSQYYLPNHTTHAVTRGADIQLMRQYFKYIRRGAVQKGVSDNSGVIDAIAVRNPGGNYTVIADCSSSVSIDLAGLPDGTYHVRYATDAGAFNQSLSDVTVSGGNSTASTTMPAAGIITFFADAATARVINRGKVTRR